MDVPLRLPWSQRLSYGVGHALNDLTASMWFSYLIVYLQLVLGFDSTYAGVVLLVGQIADAIATPLLGFEASLKNGGSICKRYGKRKFMHLIGTICVLVSFPFIFSPCPGCHASQEALTFLLVPIVAIFQFGWASTQVSHLSLIPVITPHEDERDLLNVIRNAVDIMSDISNYLVVWAVFDLTSSPGETGDRKITPEYQSKFLLIVIVIESIGAVFSLIFHIVLREVPVAPSEGVSATDSATESWEQQEDENLTWKDWLKEFHFYQVGFLYMFTRLFQNMSIVFTPLYLQEALGANDDLIAKVPLVMNISGFVVSCFLPKLFKLINKKYTLLLGSALGVGGCIWISFGEGYPYCSKGVYGVAVLMGTASSILVVCGLSFIHDLIGTSVESGAFVYGCMSFTDKLGNGLVIVTIQKLHSLYCINCDWFYKDVFTYGVGGVSTTVGLACLTLMSVELGKRDHRRSNRLLKKSSIPKPDFSSYGSIGYDADSSENDGLVY